MTPAYDSYDCAKKYLKKIFGGHPAVLARNSKQQEVCNEEV
jgi:hypothetical protein